MEGENFVRYINSQACDGLDIQKAGDETNEDQIATKMEVSNWKENIMGRS